MAEEAKQTDAPLITPVPSDEVQPEPDPAITSPTVLIRSAFVPDDGEPSTSMEETPDSTYPEGRTSPSQQPTTLQELNIGNLRKQLISQCDFSVADIESWKSMGLSVKDLNNLELDDLLKSPVLTPSYQVTKFQWLRTQFEALALNKTHGLSAHNSLVDTVTITNQNFLKVSEDNEKSFVTEDSELSAVKLEEMLGTIELSNVNNIQQCLTQFNLAERPESESSVPAMFPVSSHVSFIDTCPEKCAIANSNPASILNHLSTDLSEELSDNVCSSLLTEDVFKPDTDFVSPGHNTIPKTNQSESSRRKNNQECMKPKMSGGTKRDNKHPLNRYEESKDVSSVSRACEKANDKKTPRSEQTLEHNAEERKVCDHVVLNLPPAKATDRKDCTRKEIVHSNKNEESVVKSVIISFSQEKVKVITGLVKEDVCQPMKDIVQATTGFGTREINTLEQEKEWSEYPPVNLNINPLVSRELDAVASFRDDDVDDARTPADHNQNNGEEIISKEESCAAEIGTILPLEKQVIPSEKEKNVKDRNETTNDVDSYSSEKVNSSGQNQNSIVDLSGVAQDCLMQNDINTSQKMKVKNDDNLTEINSQDNMCDIYKGLNTSTTDSVEEAKYKNSSFTYTDGIKESPDTDMKEIDVVIHSSEGSRDLYEEKMKEDSTNEKTKIEATGVIGRKETGAFEQNNSETNSFPEIVQSFVNCQTENASSLSYLDDEKGVQLNKEIKQIVDGSENSDTFLCPDQISTDPDECVVNLSQDAIKTKSLVIEDGDSKDANGFADINPREITEEERKNHGNNSESKPLVVFEENAEQMSGPVEDIDGRVFVVKMAVTTCQTEGAATKCQLQTLERNNDLKVTKSPKPFHLATSTSSILTVNNNDVQPSGSIRISCEIKDFPDAEQSIISQEKVDVITSKFSPADYCGSDAGDTFIGTSSAIDKTRIPGYRETAQSIDFLKTTTTSINITGCSPAPINSILPDLKQPNVVDHQANIIDVTDESLIKAEPISDLEPVAVVQNNLQSIATEKQTQDAVCLKTSPDIINLLITCPQLIVDAPETVETTNPLIKNDLETDACKTTERNFETQHEDATSGLKEDEPPCLARKETERKCQAINRNECDPEQRSMAGRAPDVVSTEKGINADVQVSVAVSPVRIPEVSACGEEVRVCQKNQTQYVEPVTKSVTSKVEITTSHAIRQPQEDILIGTPNEKGARNFEQDDTCKELWESNDNSVKICHFSQSQKPPSPSTVIKQILRTESSQIFRTENERKIFAKSVEFSKSSQKESTRYKVTKNVYQVQQRKSSYGQMKVIEKGLRNIPMRKYCIRETGETSFEKDARIANRIQQMTSIQAVGKNTSQRRQTDVVQSSKKHYKTMTKNVNILEPIKGHKGKEVSERNSNPKNKLKKAISLNLKSERTITVPTEAFDSQSSGDTFYQERILSGNYYESEKSDGKGDSCDKFSDEDNLHYCSKRDVMNSQKNSRSAKQNSIQCISKAEGENKERRSAPSGHHKNLKKPKYLQTGSLDSCQETLSPVWFSSQETSPQSTSQSLKSAPNSLDSPPQEDKNFQRVHSCSLQKLSSRKARIPVVCSGGFHPQCNSPEFDTALVSSEQRENCSLMSTEKITAEDNLASCMPDRSDSSSSLVDHNQDERYTPFSLGNQPTSSSSDLTVFPISYTEIHNEMGKMYTCSNLNDYKMNRGFLNQGKFLQTLCNRFGGNESPDDSAQAPKSKNAIYLTESMFDNLSRKKRQDPYEQSAPLPPPPSPPSPSPHPSKCFFQSHSKNLGSDTPPIPKTFGKEHQNFKNLRELKALEKSLKRETSRIQKPPQVKFQPYIFTSLEPYYDTSLVRYMMEHPHGSYPGYRSRQTALGLCDPAEDLKLDTYILPKVSGKTLKKIQDSYKKAKKSSERRSPPKSSSTRLSTFPMVSLESQNLPKRQLTFSDVPMLRKELQQKCTMNAQKKILQDYQRTKEDFYRLELNRLNEIHPINRENVRASYFAYLQNTPGSRKAIYDCTQKQTQK